MERQAIADPDKIYIIRFPGEAEPKTIAMDVDASGEKFEGTATRKSGGFLLHKNAGKEGNGCMWTKTSASWREGILPQGWWIGFHIKYDEVWERSRAANTRYSHSCVAK